MGLDATTGLNYMQQRYYDPAAGRFLSVDPVTADAATGERFNRYVYAKGNPFKYTDPSGEFVAVVLPFIPAIIQQVAIAAAALPIAYAITKEVVAPAMNESGAAAAGHQDAIDRISGGAQPDRVTSTGNKIYDSPPTGEHADDIMKDIKNLEGATSRSTSGERGSVDVVNLPDGSKVIDRNSSTGPPNNRNPKNH